MGPYDIKDRQAVLDAIDECELLGEEEFLKKYGFRRAQSYWLVREGKRYSSKAILGAAHGYVSSDTAPLSAGEFYGGKPVKKVLEDLNFKIESEGTLSKGLTLTSRELQTGKIYSRNDLKQKFNITDATIRTGVFRPKDSSSVWLFVTERKPADRTPYRDSLEGDVLYWQGQLAGRTDALIMDHKPNGLELLVFYRTKIYEHARAGFRYLGEFVYSSHTGNRPTSFVLERKRRLRPISAAVKKKMPRVIFLHGINMASYCGHEENVHSGSFKTAREQGFGHEIYNFRNVNGRCYGFVQLTSRNGRPRTIDLKNLGGPASADAVDGVLVIWTAPCRDGAGREVVGWYRNATVHRELIGPSGELKAERQFEHPVTGETVEIGYRVEAGAEDCFLLHPEQRVLRIPTYPQGTKGVPGQASVYYPYLQASDVAKELRRRVLDFVNDSGTRSAKPSRTAGRPARGRQDQERKKEIEKAAVDYVCAYFGSGPKGLGFKIESRENENVGYDLFMTKGDVTLCVEVKGRSRDEVTAEFSRNESQTIQKVQKGRFAVGDYRVCIVTDALDERDNRTLHHFSWWKGKKRWIKVDGSEGLAFSPSGSTVATLDSQSD